MRFDPEILPFIEKSRAAWPVPGHRMPIADWRAKYASLVAASRPARPSNLAVHDATVGEPATPVRIYVPQRETPGGAIVYFHGGGWVIGSVETHDDITADIAHDSGLAVVSVDYSRAPECVFPRAFQEAVGVVRWVTQGGLEAFGVGRRAVLVAGDSAGGNLATTAALALAQQNVRLAGQVLLYPCVDTDFERASWRAAADTPILDAKEMAWFWDQYASSAQARADWRAVPMRASDAQLAAAPPAFLATAEHDPLRDEGIAYAHRLQQAGCAVQLESGEGLAHGYVRLRRAASGPRRIYQEMCSWAAAAASAF